MTPEQRKRAEAAHRELDQVLTWANESRRFTRVYFNSKKEKKDES